MGMVLGAIGASEQSAHAQRYVFDSYDERQGLPSPDIQAVTQDTHGALWIVSRAGVARYDGHTWEAHPTAMGGIGKTGDLHPGRDGTLWLVSSKGQGSIYQWDGETWSSVPLPEGRPPASSILTTVEGEEVLFVGRPAPSASLIRRGGRWQPVALDIVPVALSPTSNGVLIAHEEGLDRLDLVTHTRTPVAGVPRVFIRATLNDPETGQTWVVTRDWIGRVDAEGFTLLAEPLPLAQRRTKLELERDGHGGLFLGDREGLIHFSTSEGIERLDRRSGHNAGTAADLHLDRERNLWVASSRGLSKLRTLHLVGMDTEHGLLDDEVSAILHRRDGTTVLGHKTGLTFLEPKPRTLRLRDDGIDARVMDFAEDESGTLWIAAAFLGVGRLAPSGELEWIPRVSETMRQVMALHFDTEGTLWVGGQPGLGTVTAAGFVPHPSMRDMELTVRSMTGCGDRLLLATRERGAFEVDGDTLVPLQPEQGVVDAVSVLCPADNSRWIGAIDGLSVLGGELPPQLMLAQPVYALAQSYDGAIWIGSNDGLRRWKDGQLRHLSAEDGLLGAEANRHALAFDPTGRVWFGTDRGLNVYRPHYDTPRPQGPTVQIASASADAQPLSLVAPTTLDTERNSLSFQLGAIAFANEDEVRFRSRLEPLEDALSEPVLLPTRELRYPYLPPGTYRLHVRAVTASGMESTTVSSPPITFRAPLLQRPLIRLAGGTLLALAILLLSILLAQRRYAEWLEAAVRRRTTELETSRAALVAESERLGALLSSIQDAVVVLDPNGRVTLWNNAAARLLEVPVAPAMGAPLEDLLGFAEPEDGEFEFQTPDGSVRMLEMTCASIQEGHQEGGRVLALRDITARRRMEADQRRSSQLESLGLLAAGIAHDFNNLLTILLGNINLAQDTLGKDDFLEDAVQAVEQAESLTKQLLTFSKGGAPICQTTSIVELIRESVNFVLHGSTECRRRRWADGSGGPEPRPQRARGHARGRHDHLLGGEPRIGSSLLARGTLHRDLGHRRGSRHRAR